MRVHINRWQVRMASAFLVALLAQVVSLHFADAAPQRHIHNPPPQSQSIEQSRMKEGLPPNPDLTDSRVRKTAVDPKILKAKYEEAKRDADTLAGLAQSLKSDLEKGNENVAPFFVVQRAEQIEKLAKKIKKWGRAD